jgi:type II secretory ATPase GspE/PulE/Tfp pilus assembly ATPase PilB-like protein/putative methionine-R-sulfoxide reductase with GAF domain
MATVKAEEANKVQLLQQQLQFIEKLKYVTNKIHAANNVNEILFQLKDDILSLFNAEGITIYLVDPIKKQLISKYLTGSDIKEIRVPISPASISGYVASSQKILNIEDVYNEKELQAKDPHLKFDSSWDKKTGYRTKQILTAPIIFENKLLGVIQVVNKKTQPKFTKFDEKSIYEISTVLGIAFKNQAKMLHTRFDYLISSNVITEEELKAATALAREQKKDIETILMENYKVKKSDIGTSMSEFYKCKFIEYSPSVFIQRELLKGLNMAYLKKSYWLPMSLSDGKAVIIIDNPRDPKTMDIKSLIRASQYDFVVALKEDILKFLEAPEVEITGTGSMSDILAEIEVKSEDEEEVISEDGGYDEKSGTIVRLVNQMIIDGYEKGASDIHIEPSKINKKMFIRYRVDGVCFKHLEIPLSYSSPVVSRIKIMSSLDIAEKRLPQDGKIKFNYKNKPVELRVATVPTVAGEDVVLRILASTEAMPLEALNLSEKDYNNFKEMVSKPYGIILVVGPTGSGKTTTLHAALGHINTPEKKIWTAEDPVEITQEGLRQVEVKPKIDFTFERAMRSFLRANPDVIMVGEMRDKETAQIGIEASLTGHLVLTTLHTNSAPETIVRLIDMGIDPLNFADSLLGILAQRLARTLCKKCKEVYHPTKEEFDYLANAYGEQFHELGIAYNDQLTLYGPKGCDECNQTGYKGRTGIYELLNATKYIKRIIARRSTVEEIRQQAIKDGMRTLFQDGIQKVFKGITNYKQVRSVCIQ